MTLTEFEQKAMAGRTSDLSPADFWQAQARLHALFDQYQQSVLERALLWGKAPTGGSSSGKVFRRRATVSCGRGMENSVPNGDR